MDGITALAEALKGSQSLRHLEISYNPIDARGAKAIIDILKFDMKVLLSGWTPQAHKLAAQSPWQALGEGRIGSPGKLFPWPARLSHSLSLSALRGLLIEGEVALSMEMSNGCLMAFAKLQH